MRALLAALALRPGRFVPVESLVSDVWGDTDPPADAVGALQALVGRLRRTLGRDAVRSGPAGYALDATPDDVDLHVFERLARAAGQALDAGDAPTAARTAERALALWRGPALADLPDRSAAARVEALRLTVAHRRNDAWLALGRAADVVPYAEELVAAHPLNETFRAQLIRALRDAGRPADALAGYEDARRTLSERLGADPGPELLGLHAELLAGAPAPPPPAVAPEPPGATNLRPRLTSFVGRQDDLRAIRAALAGHRLVTLTGTGGAGKTRLAERTGSALLDAYPDGVWVAELAPVEEPGGVPRAVLNALGRSDTTVFPAAGREPADPTARLLEHCAHRRTLLVLDNCEHLIGAAAELAEALLTRCPGVTVLATSREPLGVPGEVVCPVGPLPHPVAIRLFAERAEAVRPGFAADPDADPDGDPDADPDADADREAVDEICRRLDGLPLAIELAAARLRILTPRQIADRLDDRFRLLTGGSRTVLPRQQTLRAVVDWSWELLTRRERTVLRRLAVFSGGCTLAAAEAVCADGEEVTGAEVLDLIGSLVDKSLVVADPLPDGTRFRLLETIEEYAAERAAEHPADRQATAARHTACYRALVESTAPRLRTADQLARLDTLETEMDNVRAALGRAVSAGDEATALAFTGSLGWFWWLRDYREESVTWLTRVAALAEVPEDEDDPMFWPRTDLRLTLFLLASDRGHVPGMSDEEAHEAARRFQAVYGRPGPQAARFPGLLWPFAVLHIDDRHDMGDLIGDVVANCRAYGGDWELACALVFRTHVTADSPGGLTGAAADWAELDRLTARVGDRWLRAQVHGAGADVALHRGEYATARTEYEAALRLCAELGAHGEVASLTARMGELSTRQGDDATATELLDRAEQAVERYGIGDSRTYIRCVRSGIALRAGDVAGARALCDLAREDAGRGTPPALLTAVLRGIEAEILVAEERPAEALRAVGEAVRTVAPGHCPDTVLAWLAEGGAGALLALGRPGPAARLLGAADTLRGELPRSVPEERSVARTRRGARAALGEPAYAEAHAGGVPLDMAGVAETLRREAGSAAVDA
ncbi:MULTISPECIES: BTAD domain-containing putative transcriptional regulator [Streptomycetaceae]|uniref:Transcriptional regulator n=1 Tax=Streptantibioticus cattleyicolor (strain ATCC 35852 / DSM 46488 / JCM 4925 / NBRC 14057 / NRRL 8057) TaxID=1003195 RepID=F8JWH9_STREN|nr:MULTISPECIES: BTAD domain-containing putative transcriptional regulator [Streptomycetaceae]AEW95761.1 transcriptional regulator [Streptantibioticus cattleyicolor NRRL 8057 = DSM 46488]MYS60304.1 AAA family ATPase [Streptomyces sp. SID5468]CCB76099.1 putative AfsR-like regulatory protein [Streptantibioticus cattleyicolor NRRL 8057 = DSM 46488]